METGFMVKTSRAENTGAPHITGMKHSDHDITIENVKQILFDTSCIERTGSSTGTLAGFVRNGDTMVPVMDLRADRDSSDKELDGGCVIVVAMNDTDVGFYFDSLPEDIV